MRKGKDSSKKTRKTTKSNRKIGNLTNSIILHQIEALVKSFESVEKKLELTNKRVDMLTKNMENQIRTMPRHSEQMGEQSSIFRAKNEQYIEPDERSLSDMRLINEQVSKSSKLASENNKLRRIHGRHREILAMLINNGFHTYSQIAEKLGISQSRARAYIADLRNDYGVPLKQVRDPEGYKIGIDVRFVEQILTSK